MNYSELVKCADEYKKDMEGRCEELRMYYRGQADDWPLKTTLQRKIEDTGKKSFEIESSEYIPVNGRTLFEQMAYNQHYSGATRLLDYSRSLDVALFFACNDPKSQNKNGVLYMCSYRERNLDSLDVCLISELACLKSRTKVVDFVDYFQTRHGNVNKEAVDITLRVISWLDHGFMVAPSEDEMEIFKRTNVRLYRQNGCFYVSGNKMDPPDARASTLQCRNVWIIPEVQELPSTITDPIRSVKKIVIPKDEKSQILNILSQKGITAESLLPPATLNI